LLPSTVEIGKEYLVFLKKRDNVLTLTTREESVISKEDTELWDGVMNQIEE
jgi:hypothetical protein